MASILRPFSSILAPGRIQVPTGQMTIDPMHPFANGLLLCYVPGAMGGANIATYGPNLVINGPGDDISNVSQEGCGMTANHGASNLGLFATVGQSFPQLTAYTTLTLYIRMYVSTVSNNFNTFFGMVYNNPNQAPFNIANIATDNANTIGLQWNTGGSQSGFSVDTLTVGNQSLLGTFPVNGTCILYRNGVNIRSSTFGGASGPNSSSGSYITLGSIGDTSLTSVIYCAYAWNRILSAAEAAALELDPYGFLVPAEYEMPSLGTPAAPLPELQNFNAFMGRRVAVIGY